MRIAIVAAIAGAAVFVIRRFLGGQDADWQAARPTTPYVPPRPAETSHSAEAAATPAATSVADEADAGDDPQSGASAHLINLEADGEAVPDQPAEGGEAEATGESVTAVEEALFESPTGEETPIEAAPEPEIAAEPEITPERGTVEPLQRTTCRGARRESARCLRHRRCSSADARSERFQGEGVYVGHEPPEGFTIKGNERSMKYHVPESSGYARTVAEVWFNSEEAAQQAGFVRAQR